MDIENHHGIIRNGYNKAAKPYRDVKTDSLLKVDTVIKALQGSGKKVLELGCGSGYPIAEYLLHKDNHYTGIDISDNQISLAQMQYPEGEFIRAEMLAYCQSSGDETYDLICSFFAIFHLPQTLHQPLFEQIHRILKPKGTFLFNTPLKEENSTIEGWFTADRMIWQAYAPQEYDEILEKIGFRVSMDTGTTMFTGKKEETMYLRAEKL